MALIRRKSGAFRCFFIKVEKLIMAKTYGDIITNVCHEKDNAIKCAMRQMVAKRTPDKPTAKQKSSSFLVNAMFVSFGLC